MSGKNLFSMGHAKDADVEQDSGADGADADFDLAALRADATAEEDAKTKAGMCCLFVVMLLWLVLLWLVLLWL